ncbi:glycosyltransferase family 4 protein [Chitinolyticbacter meiyuanensis]|uniref:glycosyltransferase family 4 protein n=1 Tax=Chitinolyticbacter meiyuanensis TaxID=682798 RepID=UPI0011E5FAB8|nr:glycosyltransferase family 4 protein [Chitinolyticbacter meiyuanensis]
MKQRKSLLILATAENGKGGIASVIKTYRESGLFARWPLEHLATHVNGSSWQKLRTFVFALLHFAARLLFKRDVAAVHIHTASNASYWRKLPFLLLCRACRVPYLLHVHGAGFIVFYENRSGALGQWLIRYGLRHADEVIALSSQWAADLARIEPQAKVVRIYNPIAEVEALKAERKHDCILFLGEVGKRKGVFELISALAEILPRRAGTKLWIGGLGDIEGAKLHAQKLGVSESIEWLGWVVGPQKQQLLSTATVLALPSYNEGLPMSILEALSFGVPVVSTTVGGIPDALGEDGGTCLVEPGDVSALASALLRVLESDELQLALAERGRRRVKEHFSTTVVMSQLDGVYQRLLAR